MLILKSAYTHVFVSIANRNWIEKFPTTEESLQNKVLGSLVNLAMHLPLRIFTCIYFLSRYLCHEKAVTKLFPWSPGALLITWEASKTDHTGSLQGLLTLSPTPTLSYLVSV